MHLVDQHQPMAGQAGSLDNDDLGRLPAQLDDERCSIPQLTIQVRGGDAMGHRRGVLSLPADQQTATSEEWQAQLRDLGEGAHGAHRDDVPGLPVVVCGELLGAGRDDLDAWPVPGCGRRRARSRVAAATTSRKRVFLATESTSVSRAAGRATRERQPRVAAAAAQVHDRGGRGQPFPEHRHGAQRVQDVESGHTLRCLGSRSG